MMKLTQAQQAWIDDLLTTDAPQAREALRTKYGFCCLGRACVILDTPVHTVEGSLETTHYGVPGDNDPTELPVYVAAQLGLKDQGGKFDRNLLTDAWKAEISPNRWQLLTQLNDTALWPFEKIGRFIQDNPEAVFAQ